MIRLITGNGSYNDDVGDDYRRSTIVDMGTEAEIQLPLKRSSRFQRLFPNPSWLV